MARWLGIPCGVALAFVALALARAETATAVTLGDLTFHYKPEAWRIVPDGDGLVAACVQDDCRGATIDISRRDGEDGCTKGTMAAEAERLFPDARRSHENILPSGRFALVLAQRHVGRDPGSPQFVLGCVAWQGSEYRFAMRPETVGTQSWIGGALHYLVSQATAPEARVETVRIGEVDFAIQTEIWRFSEMGEGGGLLLPCRAPTCREPTPLATLSSRSPAEPCPAPQGAFEDGAESETLIQTLPATAPDGLSFTVSTTLLGCRNYVPPHIEACSVHGDRSYHLSALEPQGFQLHVWDIPEQGLVDLLRSARIAR